MKKISVLLLSLSASIVVAQTNTFPSSGNAGIGTTSPSVPFEIGTTLNQGDPILKFGNPQQYNQIIFRDRSHSSFLFGVEANQIKIGTTGNEHKLMSIQYNAHNIELWPTVAVNSPSNILINAGANVGIGTTTPQHKLDVNGGQRINGSFINTTWIGSGNRLLQVNSTGSVSPFNMGNATDVLYGNGTWGSLPASVNSFTASGNTLFTSSTTSLGIGTNSPQYLLDVNGDAHIKNNLYVDGQILITDRVESGTISTDTIRADTGRVVMGDTRVMNKFEVGGNSRFAGIVQADQGIMFDAFNGLKMYAETDLSPGVFSFGRTSPTGPPVTINPCFAPSQDPWFFFGGRIQTFDAASNTALTMGSDGVQSVIEHSGNNGLLVNYYCGKNIYLGTGTGSGTGGLGTAGAKVFTGDEFYARKNVQIGNPGGPIDPNVSLNVLLNGTTSGLKLWSGAIPTVKLIHDNYDQFIVMGDGRTSIGVNRTVGAAPYKMLTVNGDVSLANYYSGTGANLDGFDGLEILGNNQIPTRRGITTDADPNGSLNFYINTNQSPAGFNFKNGNGNKQLAFIDANGRLHLNNQTPSGDALTINDGAGKTNFKVLASGRTEIHVQNPTANDKPFYIVDDFNNKDIFLVKSNGKTYAREVEISLITQFPDYVFANSYKLMEISELDKYIKMNKHLPGFQNAEHYEKNGINVNNMMIQQQEKIEELTLYIIELEKRIKQVESKK